MKLAKARAPKNGQSQSPQGSGRRVQGSEFRLTPSSTPGGARQPVRMFDKGQFQVDPTPHIRICMRTRASDSRWLPDSGLAYLICFCSISAQDVGWTANLPNFTPKSRNCTRTRASASRWMIDGWSFEWAQFLLFQCPPR